MIKELNRKFEETVPKKEKNNRKWKFVLYAKNNCILIII